MTNYKRNSRSSKNAGLLSSEWRKILSPEVGEIRGLLNRESGCRVEIGRKLLCIKGKLGHGQWLTWLKEELQVLSIPTAGNYVRIAQFCDERGIVDFTNLPLSALIDLSRTGNTPEQIEVALKEAEEGPVSHKRMREILKPQKPEPEPEAPPVPAPEILLSPQPVMSMEDVMSLRDLLRQRLKDDTALYEKLVDAAKERGVRLHIIGKSGALDVLGIEEVLTPHDPDWPPWAQEFPPQSTPIEIVEHSKPEFENGFFPR